MGRKKKVAPFRDAIHGMIEVTEDEIKVIDTRVVQSMRRKDQLSSASLVFQTASTFRFPHSMGVKHLAGKYGEVLIPHDPQKPPGERELQIKLLTVAALLHDVAHGPASHAFDRAIYSTLYPDDPDHGHDHYRHKLLREDPELNAVIHEIGLTPEMIDEVWDGRHRLFHAIISGPCGADRLDYMPRDARLGGTSFGQLNPLRIIHSAVVVWDPEHPGDLSKATLAFREKCLDDLVHVLTERCNMYSSIYHHKTCMASKLLMEEVFRGLAQCFDFSLLLRDHFNEMDDAFIDVLCHRLEDIPSLGIGIESETPHPLIKSWCVKSPFSIACATRTRRLWRQLRDRKLPKRVVEFPLPLEIHRSLEKFSLHLLRPGFATLAASQRDLIEQQVLPFLYTHPQGSQFLDHFRLMLTSSAKEESEKEGEEELLMVHCTPIVFGDISAFDREHIPILRPDDQVVPFGQVIVERSFFGCQLQITKPTVLYRVYRFE